MKAPDIFVELFRVFGSRNLRRGVKNIMKGFINYLLPRIIQWFIVIFVGITVAFIIPRLSPVDPVEAVLNKMAGYSIMNPQAVSELRETLEALFGTDKNIFVQYTEFWGRLLKGDLGPSLSMFPVPVIDIIKTSLPWSVFLLLSSTIIAWLLGIFLGTMITVNSKKKWAKLLEGLVTFLYPIPHYILALALLFLFAYLFPVFPLTGAYGIGSIPEFNLRFIRETIKHSFLPALSIILVSLGWTALSQKALVSNLLSSDFMKYAKIGGVPKQTRFFYLISNSALPQVTDLALSLGTIFSGSLIVEVVFSYPGLGQVLQSAILQGDYNTIMGITAFSIIAIASAALILDLIYPLLDPRIRRG